MSVVFHLARHRIPIAAVLVSGVVMIAGCGGSSKPSTSKPSSVSKSTSSLVSEAVAFSRCMRAHGLPNFPDPNASDGFQINSNGKFKIHIGPRGPNEPPAFQAAQSACQNLFPPISGAAGKQNPTAETMTQMLTVAKCMRAHRVPNWPDPTTYLPSSPSGYREVIDHNGGVFLIRFSIDIQSPAVKHAEAVCQLP